MALKHHRPGTPNPEKTGELDVNFNASTPGKAEAIFRIVTSWPKLIMLLTLLSIGGFASFIPQLHKDTSSDAFIAADDEVLIYREHVRKTFGLEDPIVIAVINKGETGIFNPETLALVGRLTSSVAALGNIDPERVTSLATESNIVGTDDGMEVSDFFDPAPTTQASADAIKAAIADFPLYQGTLVARGGEATLIIAELLDQTDAQATYQQILDLVAAAEVPAGNAVHVAGEGAVAGYMATYIDNDAKTLNPLAGLVITLVLFVAFRTLAGTILPNIIVMGTVAASLGLMAAFGVSFYVITNGLATILIGIAVADSIHILSQVYEEQVRDPGANRQEIAVRAMVKMWKPVTLTSVTTIAGFMGLWLAAQMPPMAFFGLFAAIGVAAAWVYSIVFLPAALTFFRVKPSKIFKAANENDRYGAFLKSIGAATLRVPKATLIIGLIVAVVGTYGASKVIVQEEQIANFQTDEPLYIADKEINRVMDGTYFLDVVIEADEPEGLYEPAALRRIEALQNYFEADPAVKGSTSVVDYIKQMHKAVNENRAEFYTIPDDPDLIAQLFLLYSASGDPTDFEEEIDTEYRQANVRFNLPQADYRLLTTIVPKFQHYVETEFNTPGLTAHLSGRVSVNHKWLKTIGDNHVKSLGLSLLFVLIAATIVFRSLLAGLISILPVIMSLLMVYAVMGFAGIWLGVGTSMFAAIAIGLGIDFSIHTLDRMKDLLASRTGTFDERLADLFPSTGRALFFNFAALGLGFAVLLTSDVPPLVSFGLLVVVAVSAAFVAGITLLPALGKLFKPAFLMGEEGRISGEMKTAGIVVVLAVVAVLGGMILMPGKAHADDTQSAQSVQNSLTADEIIAKINARSEGQWVSRKLTMELVDRRGKSRIRETVGYRRYYGPEKRTVIFYTSPRSVKGTGFLTYDYPEADRDDDQWLYLPALRKIRRISASDRGDYFLGTDFTYEDIKKESKISAEDYRYKRVGFEEVDGHQTILIEAVPINDAVAKELGYGRILLRVDPVIWMNRKSEMWDTGGNALKTIKISDIREIDGIWTAHEMEVKNHKTNHITRFHFADIDYITEVEDAIFEQRTLTRGR